ncbi:MAG: ABC transporter permease, partial [Actinomadura sp.]
VWQLSRYGGPATAEPAAAVGMDPFIVATPALALLAGGTLALRLVPVASQAAERLISRGRGLAAGLGTRQVSRRPLRYARPALLLVMAVAIGVLSVATESTWHRSQLDQADFQAGADLRVAVPAEPSGPLVLGQGGRLDGLPGVTALSPVLRRQVTAGDQEVALVAGDAAVLGSLLRARPDVMGRSAPATLTAARPKTAPPAVPGRPDRIAFDLRLTSRAAGDATALQVLVTMADGRGVTHELDLGGVPADGTTRTRVVTAADLAGPGGRITFPLMVRGVRYQFAENPRGTDLELSVLRIRSVDGTDTGTPAPAEWHALSADPSGNGAPRIQDRPDTFVTLGIPAATSSGGGAVAATSADRANSGTDTALAPIPGIITAELARRARVGLGGTVTIDHAGEEQPITVTGVVSALPSTEPDRPAVLVDLPTLTERLLTAGHPAPEPGEWWLAVRGADTAPAVRVLAAQPDWTGPIVDRTALRQELRDAPLAAAPQGALLIGFLAALVLALIGFTVNATVSVRERASEFAMLRALGAGPRQVFGMLGVEQAFLGALGLLGGVVLGLAVAQLVIPHVVLTPRAAAPYPPVDIVISWGPILGLLSGVVLLLGVVLALLGHALRRAGFDTAGRIGADG